MKKNERTSGKTPIKNFIIKNVLYSVLKRNICLVTVLVIISNVMGISLELKEADKEKNA